MVRRAFALMAVFAIAMMATPHVSGNAGPPRPPIVVDNTGNNFVIELDPTAKQARLIVPKKFGDGPGGARFGFDRPPRGRRIASGISFGGRGRVAGVGAELLSACGWCVATAPAQKSGLADRGRTLARKRRGRLCRHSWPWAAPAGTTATATELGTL